MKRLIIAIITFLAFTLPAWADKVVKIRIDYIDVEELVRLLKGG